MMRELTDDQNVVLENITEFLHPDIGYSELEDLVDDDVALFGGSFDSEESLRDFARAIADHLGIEWELTREEAKEVWEENQMDSERIARHFGEEY